MEGYQLGRGFIYVLGVMSREGRVIVRTCSLFSMEVFRNLWMRGRKLCKRFANTRNEKVDRIGQNCRSRYPAFGE